jgi:VanZ family protein
LTLAIFSLSSRPYTAYFAELEGPSHRLFQTYLQYPAHLAEYAVLALFWLRALHRHGMGGRRLTWMTLGAIALTALIDESIQGFVPTRSFALRDLLMDSLGGLLAVVVSHRTFSVLSEED